MTLQRIVMKLLIYTTEFGMTNWSTEAVLCLYKSLGLYEKFEELVIERDIGKIVIFLVTMKGVDPRTDFDCL